jgi:hypothetical protein
MDAGRRVCRALKRFSNHLRMPAVPNDSQNHRRERGGWEHFSAKHFFPAPANVPRRLPGEPATAFDQ